MSNYVMSDAEKEKMSFLLVNLCLCLQMYVDFLFFWPPSKHRVHGGENWGLKIQPGSPWLWSFDINLKPLKVKTAKIIKVVCFLSCQNNYKQLYLMILRRKEKGYQRDTLLAEKWWQSGVWTVTLNYLLMSIADLTTEICLVSDHDCQASAQAYLDCYSYFIEGVFNNDLSTWIFIQYQVLE